jgi:MYXO-CTERM domain-containing protein
LQNLDWSREDVFLHIGDSTYRLYGIYTSVSVVDKPRPIFIDDPYPVPAPGGLGLLILAGLALYRRRRSV